MELSKPKKQVAIIGGGPSGLFMFKRLLEAADTEMVITIFERKDSLGAGMPYSPEGANDEHITNVSGNEIPEIVTSIKEWLRIAPKELLQRFNMKPELFNEYKVVPRLLFGEYLVAQFALLLKAAKKAGVQTNVITNTTVINIEDDATTGLVQVFTSDESVHVFNSVVICTGHKWPKKLEGKIKNWFDSPYPPGKLASKINYPVAVKGASLSAIDAVRTLARCNGTFTKNEDSTLTYQVNDDSPDFKIVMHSLSGLLPAIRFHLEDSQLSKGSLLSEEEIKESMKANGGFIPLDFIFENNFREPLRKQHPDFYEEIKDISMEEFVDHMMTLREHLDAFVLFKAEYAEAEKSIRRKQSVYWKEMLAVLSYAMNYPAKHLSAEDMLRLKQKLMPLISIVIAFVPQSSCRELIALHDAGVLSLITVDRESTVEPAEGGGALYTYKNEEGETKQVSYKMFIDAIGQPHYMFEDFPFAGLIQGGSISRALLPFKLNEEGAKLMEQGNKQVEQDSLGNFYLQVPGININDQFQVLDKYGAYNERIYIMAVPYIGGLNPDYSGLDFCEEASGRIAKAIEAAASSEEEKAA